VIVDVIPRATRRFTNFSGDLSGRYIEALSIAAGTGAKSPTLDRTVADVLSLQKPDGHFGGSLNQAEVDDEAMALLWGQGRLLVGLVEYYQLTHNPAALEAARRLGGFLVGPGAAIPAERSPPEIQRREVRGRLYLLDEQSRRSGESVRCDQGGAIPEPGEANRGGDRNPSIAA
jgi:hypothetical protein